MRLLYIIILVTFVKKSENLKNKKNLSITQTFSEAWVIMRLNLKSCLLIFTPLLMPVLIGFTPMLSQFGVIFIWILSLMTNVALSFISLKLADGQTITIKDLFTK